MAAVAAGASAAAIGQPVTFIGQPSFAFQPIGKVCCDFANKTDKHSIDILCRYYVQAVAVSSFVFLLSFSFY